VLASSPGTKDFTPPAGPFLWLLFWIVVVAASPLVLAYLVFFIRELIRGPQPAEPPRDDESP
jgi:hypothetical protein